MLLVTLTQWDKSEKKSNRIQVNLDNVMIIEKPAGICEVINHAGVHITVTESFDEIQAMRDAAVSQQQPGRLPPDPTWKGNCRELYNYALFTIAGLTDQTSQTTLEQEGPLRMIRDLLAANPE